MFHDYFLPKTFCLHFVQLTIDRRISIHIHKSSSLIFRSFSSLVTAGWQNFLCLVVQIFSRKNRHL